MLFALVGLFFCIGATLHSLSGCFISTGPVALQEDLKVCLLDCYVVGLGKLACNAPLFTGETIRIKRDAPRWGISLY